MTTIAELTKNKPWIAQDSLTHRYRENIETGPVVIEIRLNPLSNECPNAL